MKVGDLIKRRGEAWYAIVIGFRTVIEFKTMGITEQLPEGDTGYPIFVWVELDGHVSASNGRWPDDLGDIQSCSASLMEVVESPSACAVDGLLEMHRTSVSDEPKMLEAKN